MIAIPNDRSPNRRHQPPANSDACLTTFSVDAAPSSQETVTVDASPSYQMPTPPVSKANATSRTSSSTAESGGDSRIGLWILIAVIGGLFRAATSPNFQKAQPG